MIRGLMRRLHADERGIALPVVLGLGLVMLLLVSASLTTVTGGVQKTKTDEDAAGARSAAYAGVEEYQSRLANDSTYYKFGNPNAGFSASSKTLLSLPTGANVNPAFNISASQSWATIPDSNGASYRYEVDISDYSSKGTIRLRSTGRVGTAVSTLVADLKQSGFIDFLYFTDYEETDPAFNSTYRNTIPQKCDKHLWESPSRPSDCSSRIQFGKFDSLYGPVHSNDTLELCGTKFYGTLTTSNPTASYDTADCSGTTGPKFYQPKDPTDSTAPDVANPAGKVVYEKPLDIPPTNSQMQTETYTDKPADVPNPGCLYTGPTSITFTDDGNMKVVSPWTRATETNTAGTTGTTPAKCGSIAALHSTAGAVIPVLDLNLIFVQSVSGDSTNVNYWASTVTPAAPPVSYGTSTASGFSCLTTASGSNTGWKFGTVQYPLANETLPPTSTTDTPAYSCRAGDLYVSGKVSGRTTLAAYNYIYITGDLKYVDPANDILGLVGQNAVWVWNPIVSTSVKSGSKTTITYSYGLSGLNRTVDAAILSVAHTFFVQNYSSAVPSAPTNSTNVTTALVSRGTLTVLGAIAQKYRGTVATSDSSGNVATGYAKSYQYDERFRYTAPPKFLTPVSTTYGVTQYAGVKAAYKADGTPIP
jgi:hypothetical protein